MMKRILYQNNIENDQGIFGKRYTIRISIFEMNFM